MQIPPSQQNNNPSSSGPIGTTGSSQPTHKKPPKKDFNETLRKGTKNQETQLQKKNQQSSDQKETEETPPSLLSALAAEKQQLAKLAKEELAKSEKNEENALKNEGKGKKKESTATTGAGAGTQTPTQGIPGQQPIQLGVDVAGGTAETKPTTSIEKLIDVFEKNRLFESGVNQVQVVPRGNETQVSVTLSSGIKVDVNMAAGGHDLNIHITGLTATVQAAIDNPQHQQQLRQLLIEKGFTVHQIVTERAEQAPISASSRDQPSQQGRDDRGGGGGRGGEQQGGQQQPRR